MVRKFECIVPRSQSDKIKQVLSHHRSVHHLSSRKCVDDTNTPSISFTFKTVNKKAHDLIDILRTYGVSTKFGTLDVIPLASTKPRIKTKKDDNYRYVSAGSIGLSQNPLSSTSNFAKKKKKKYAVHERLAYDEIYDAIDDTLHLTFDYLALVVCGGIIAACGLLNDSPVVVVASMLVSPLMGPIVGMTFGHVVGDRAMFWKSFRNESIGIALLWATGAFMGFLTAPFMDDPFHRWLVYGDNTQMQSRGTWVTLLWGCGIAAPSGVALMLGVANDAFLAVIGVAIAAALLPPIANSGLAMASATVFYISPKYDADVSWNWMLNGIISMLLFLINWALIFILGIWTFRIKRLHQNQDDEERLNELNKWLESRKKNQPLLFKSTTSIHSISSAKNKENTSFTPLIDHDSDNDGNNNRGIYGTSALGAQHINKLMIDDQKGDLDDITDNDEERLNELENKVNYLMSVIKKENLNINNDVNDVSTFKTWYDKNIQISEYYDKFVSLGFDSMTAVREISENDLITMGVDKKGHRIKILKIIQEHKST